LKHFVLTCLLIILLSFISGSTGCKRGPTEPSNQNQSDTSIIDVRKPNIYLYPKTRCTLSIKLLFPLGGTIIQSVPAYINGWLVDVEPSGKINQQYDFLFYESQTPDAYQYNSGWLVSRDTLLSFFSNNLLQIGFSEQEKNDFTAYWIPKLSDHPFYLIYPQFADDIGKVIQLNISPPPDNILRLFYVIKGSEINEAKLTTPLIPKFTRSGFVIAEWGVALK
jgi:hypothetical protein